MNNTEIQPIVLCGGTGSRLWPLSRESYPKQFLKINDEQPFTFLQQTIKRIKKINNAKDPIFICNERHRFIVAEQIREINSQFNSIILEPIVKNTAPAITAAAIKSIESENDPILLVLPSDHIVKDLEKFSMVVNKAIKFANKGKLITFGIIPDEAATGYGYIESENPLSEENLTAEKILRFIEKPNKSLAEKLIVNQKFSWNSGIFMFRASSFLEEIKNKSPNIYNACSEAVVKKKKDLDFYRLDKVAFSSCENISIDKAVMEKTNNSVVLPLNVGWSDIGDWSSLWKVSEKDDMGNVISGNIISKDIKNSYLRSSNRLILGLGFSNLIIIETIDAILIADKSQAQNIKNIVKELVIQNRSEATTHKKVFRPWGSYQSIAMGENWQLKKLQVNPGQSLSMQLHKYRTEHWIVVSGKAFVELDNKRFELNTNQSTYIPQNCKHRLSNTNEKNLILMEIQCGDYLGEDDILRFEDKYGRIDLEN